MEQQKEGLLTPRNETSAQQRYTQLGCAVCRNRPHGDGDGDGIMLWNPYACAFWAAVAIGRRHITAQYRCLQARKTYSWQRLATLL